MDPQTFVILFALFLAIVYLVLRLIRRKPEPVQRVIRQQHNAPRPVHKAEPAVSAADTTQAEPPGDTTASIAVLPKSDGWRPLQPSEIEAETVWRLEHTIREMKDLGREQMVRIDFNMDPKDLATVLASNPFYAARILKTVNSAAVGLRTRIDSLPRAITYLGYNQVKNIVFQHMLDKNLSDQSKVSDRFDLFKFWVHSHAVSICADYLLRNVIKQPQLIGLVTTAALLHDIGWVVFERYDRSTADRLFEELGSGQVEGDPMEVEESLFGFNHLAAGRMLAEHWEIPQSVCELVGMHHCGAYGLEAGIGRELALGACVVAKSEQLCATLGYANPLAEPSGAEIDLTPVLGTQAAGMDSAPPKLREDVEKVIKFIREFNRG